MEIGPAVFSFFFFCKMDFVLGLLYFGINLGFYFLLAKPKLAITGGKGA